MNDPPQSTPRPHIVDGQFQSDKYPTCPPGKVPLSVKDLMAQDLLWEYAQRRRAVDVEFSDDLEWALREAGYAGCGSCRERMREQSTALFVLGRFVGHSGGDLDWKIECDALSDQDWECLAFHASKILPPFGPVEGVPRGGLRFAEALRVYSQDGAKLLIADDVLTTGKSLDEARAGRDAWGIVAFSRNDSVRPIWIVPVWSLHSWQTIEAAMKIERARCIALIRHHMESHRQTATIHSNPMDIARHEQAAAALETVLERIECP